MHSILFIHFWFATGTVKVSSEQALCDSGEKIKTEEIKTSSRAEAANLMVWVGQQEINVKIERDKKSEIAERCSVHYGSFPNRLHNSLIKSCFSIMGFYINLHHSEKDHL